MTIVPNKLRSTDERAQSTCISNYNTMSVALVTDPRLIRIYSILEQGKTMNKKKIKNNNIII